MPALEDNVEAISAHFPVVIWVQVLQLMSETCAAKSNERVLKEHVVSDDVAHSEGEHDPKASQELVDGTIALFTSPGSDKKQQHAMSNSGVAWIRVRCGILWETVGKTPDDHRHGLETAKRS